MIRLPISEDLAEIIGSVAQHVENRSLLLDKFCFHKSWPVEQDDRGFVRWDEASRWSFIRIAHGAKSLLTKDAKDKRWKANGQNVRPEKSQRLMAEASIAESLSNVAWDRDDLGELRTRHARHFLAQFLSQAKGRSVVVAAQLEGRLAINLATGLIRNAGISLDRLFGLPVIPGSALKGIARAAAYEELAQAQGGERAHVFDRFCRVFGTADSDFKRDGELAGYGDLLANAPADLRGSVAFLQSVPLSDAKIVVDLTNVHYPDYYQGSGRDIPPGVSGSLFNENPKPNPFPCVKQGARFAFCLTLVRPDGDAELLQAARRWLEQALTVRGLGAKTAVGYGWFSILDDSVIESIRLEGQRDLEKQIQQREELRRKQAAAAAEAARMASLKPEDQAKEAALAHSDEVFASKVLDLQKLPSVEQHGVLMALADASKRDKWKKWRKSDKDNDKKRVAIALEIAKNLGINLP